MRYKIYFLVVTAFFVTMNVLLWRSEFSARGRFGTPLPPEAVWEKVLTSPDFSHLEVRHKGVKIGLAHWSAQISEAPAPSLLNTDELPPEGMIKRVTGYALHFDSTVSLDDLSRLRIDCRLDLATNQSWQEFSLKLALKPAPSTWEFHASAAKGTFRFLAEDEEGRREQTFKFSDLQNPEKLARSIGGPLMPAMLTALGLPMNAPPGGKPAGAANLSLGLAWEARNDWLKLGRNPIRVYRIEAKLFERFRAVFFVSPIGELLRVELPDEIVLMNEALINL